MVCIEGVEKGDGVVVEDGQKLAGGGRKEASMRGVIEVRVRTVIQVAELQPIMAQ
jgi:hypothetical protein